MKEFPKAVFHEGGIETSDDCDGHTFTSRVVNDEDELQAAREQGWHTSVAALVQAVKAAQAAKPSEQGQQVSSGQHDDSAPPTRAELEQKATELGVEFSAKLGDKKLAERIEAKLAEQAAQASQES